MTVDPELKSRPLSWDLGKRALGQLLIVGFLAVAMVMAAGIQNRNDTLVRQNDTLERRIAASCEVLGVPPGDACRAEIRRLHEEDLLRQGAALTRPDPVPPLTIRQDKETRDAPNAAERARIRRCLRDINRVLDGQARRAASCRNA